MILSTSFLYETVEPIACDFDNIINKRFFINTGFRNSGVTMSSLAAARADNFYNPPDWDPSEVSRDQYQGSKGSNQYEERGEIRFEMPWNLWCTSCDSHIGRGVRFNAKKTEIGRYFSTKIWEFAMKCHLCGGRIVICTDPQNCDYKVTEGGKRRCMDYSTADLEVIEIHDEAHKERMETDAIYRLQHQEEDKRKKRENALRLQALHRLQQREKDDDDNKRITLHSIRK